MLKLQKYMMNNVNMIKCLDNLYIEAKEIK